MDYRFAVFYLTARTSGYALETLFFVYGYQVTDFSAEVTSKHMLACVADGGSMER